MAKFKEGDRVQLVAPHTFYGTAQNERWARVGDVGTVASDFTSTTSFIRWDHRIDLGDECVWADNICLEAYVDAPTEEELAEVYKSLGVEPPG